MVEPNGSLDLWCQVCRTTTEVAAEWSVTFNGKAMVTGPCGRCGTRVVARFVKTREAPREIAVAARAADRTYRHFRTRHREQRDETVRRLTGHRWQLPPEEVGRLAAAFGLRPERIRLILRGD